MGFRCLGKFENLFDDLTEFADLQSQKPADYDLVFDDRVKGIILEANTPRAGEKATQSRATIAKDSSLSVSSTSSIRILMRHKHW
ncbi:hypothetical protein CHU98_g8327 [Xylaria longipes]|nr:hypothetical protein CHU98_g8327 [Xylaria longipes]